MSLRFYTLLLFSATAVIFISVSSFGLYPVISVNGSLVWAKNYYGLTAGFNRYNGAADVLVDEKPAGRGMIMSLVADEIVLEEFRLRGFSENDAQKRVDEALQKDGANLSEASAKLYGWTLKDLKRFSLLPQARQDLIYEALQKEGVEFGAWLSGRLAKSDIKIYFLPYRWQDGQLVDK